MNRVERALRQADTAQQRFGPTAFLFGVLKKYGDDNAGVLVSNLAYAAFVSIFPLLLILVTVLVNIAARDPSLRTQVIRGATSEFPLIGHQLASNIHSLRRATAVSLAIGLLLLVWGVTRLAQAGLFTMAQVWNLPGPDRPGYLPRLVRSVLFLGLLALGVVISTLLGGLITYGQHALGFRLLAQLLAALANVGLFVAGFRVLTPKAVPSRRLLPGAVTGGLLWTLLQALGAYLVHRYLRSDSVYGIFATVLGLLAWIYLGVEGMVYSAEVNTVLAARLWPRAMVQPPLTDADRASMARQALQNRRRPEQVVEVSFTDEPGARFSDKPDPQATRKPEKQIAKEPDPRPPRQGAGNS